MALELGELGSTAGLGPEQVTQTEILSAPVSLFEGPLIDNSMLYSREMIARPMQRLDSDGPFTFYIPGESGLYIDPDSFNLGWPAANVTDNGNVTVRYANTSATAGQYFNVGWSDGGAWNAALTAFRETSGGTEFAPLAGSGGVAIVGPASGTVATFAKTGTVTTAAPI